MNKKSNTLTRLVSVVILIVSIMGTITPVTATGEEFIYGTFFGGSRKDQIRDIALDSNGNIIIVGGTFSEDLPVLDAAQEVYGGGAFPSTVEWFRLMGEGFVAKFSPEYELLWATYLGGSEMDLAYHVVVDSGDNILVFGQTISSDFPVTDVSTSTDRENGDSFIVRYTPDGEILESTFYEVDEVSLIQYVEQDPDGNLVLVGQTNSEDYVCTDDALQASLGGEDDGFIRVLTEDFGTLIYSTYLGGSGSDFINKAFVASSGGIYVSGSTQSDDFPVSEDAFRPEYIGDPFDDFVAKLSSGGEYEYGTYFGGTELDDIFGLTADAEGNAIAVGRTWSPDFIVTEDALQPEYSGVEVDGFITQFDAQGTRLLYSTFYGLDDWDSLLQIDLDEEGRMFITGFVGSGGFETVNPFQADHLGWTDMYVMIMDQDIELASYLGGYGSDHPFAQVLSDGKIFIVGSSQSPTFPVSESAYQEGFHGEEDGIIWVLDYEGYLGGDHAVESPGPDYRPYISYGVVLGAIAAWLILTRSSFSNHN